MMMMMMIMMMMMMMSIEGCFFDVNFYTNAGADIVAKVTHYWSTSWR